MEYTIEFLRSAAAAAGLSPAEIEKLAAALAQQPALAQQDKFLAAALAAAGMTKLTGQPDTTS